MGVDVLRKLKMSRVTLLILFLTLGVGSLTVCNCTRHSGIVSQIPLRVVSAEGGDGDSGRSDADVYRSGNIQTLRGRKLIMMAITKLLHFYRFPSRVKANNLDNPAVLSIRHNPSAPGSKAPHTEVLYSRDEFQERSRALLSNNPDLSLNGISIEDVFHEDYTQPRSNVPIIEDPWFPPQHQQEA